MPGLRLAGHAPGLLELYSAVEVQPSKSCAHEGDSVMTMSFMVLLLGVFVAGGLGAWCRFSLDGFISQHWRHEIPAGTFVINVLGSFGLGIITGFGAQHADFGPWVTILGTGLMGGFTTFSTANVEVLRLMLAGRRVAGLGLVITMLVTASGAGLLGLGLGLGEI